MKKIFLVIFSFSFYICAGKITPIGITKFKTSTGIINLKGQEFIVVSVRERGSDGRFYAVDRDGVVWWSGGIASGADDFKTPSGLYTVKYKKRYYMSKAYPSADGINNMDYSIFFSYKGYALHQGSISWMSHGCIHIDPKDIQTIYRWANRGTKVIITRGTYMPYASKDLIRFKLK